MWHLFICVGHLKLVFIWSVSLPRLKIKATAPYPESSQSPNSNLSINPSTVYRAGGLSELTQTSQDEKTLNLNVILLGPQRIHCVGIQKDIPGCERGSFLFFAHWPPPSLSGAACLSLTTAACCLWRPGVSGAAPDICRPWALAAELALSSLHIHRHTLEPNVFPAQRMIFIPPRTVSAGEEVAWSSRALALSLSSPLSPSSSPVILP